MDTFDISIFADDDDSKVTLSQVLRFSSLSSSRSSSAEKPCATPPSPLIPLFVSTSPLSPLPDDVTADALMPTTVNKIKEETIENVNVSEISRQPSDLQGQKRPKVCKENRCSECAKRPRLNSSPATNHSATFLDARLIPAHKELLRFISCSCYTRGSVENRSMAAPPDLQSLWAEANPGSAFHEVLLASTKIASRDFQKKGDKSCNASALKVWMKAACVSFGDALELPKYAATLLKNLKTLQDDAQPCIAVLGDDRTSHHPLPSSAWRWLHSGSCPSTTVELWLRHVDRPCAGIYVLIGMQCTMRTFQDATSILSMMKDLRDVFRKRCSDIPVFFVENALPSTLDNGASSGAQRTALSLVNQAYKHLNFPVVPHPENLMVTQDDFRGYRYRSLSFRMLLRHLAEHSISLGITSSLKEFGF